MGWLLGVGLLVIGAFIIIGVFVIGQKKGTENGPNHAVPNDKQSVTQLGSAELVNLLQKGSAAGDFQVVDGIVDQLDVLSPETANEARQIILQSGLVERYKTGLADVDYRVRAVNAERLGKISGTGISEVLFQAMADKNEEVRHAAAGALKRLNDPAVAGMLVNALKDPNRWLPARVAEVLVALGKPAVPALQQALNDSDPGLRSYVIEILGEIGDQSGIEALHQALADGSGNVRLQAARALGNIGHEGSAPHLAGLLDDQETRVVIQAVRSLGRIGGRQAAAAVGQILDHDDQVVRGIGLDVLRRQGPEGLEIIAEAADREGCPVGEAARQILKDEGIFDSARVNITYE